MTTAMIAFLPKGEWTPANIHASGLALNLNLEDRDPETGAVLGRTSLAFHYAGITPLDAGQYADKDAEAVGRDALASAFVTAAGALFETATPAVQKRMGALIDAKV